MHNITYRVLSPTRVVTAETTCTVYQPTVEACVLSILLYLKGVLNVEDYSPELVVSGVDGMSNMNRWIYGLNKDGNDLVKEAY